MLSASQRVRVDLHCHSAFSDGELSPEQLAPLFAAAGVRYASLTDHETLRGLERFRAGLEQYNIQTIPGAEIEVQSLGGAVHLLAYGFDPQNRTFQDYLTSLRHPLWAFTTHWINPRRFSPKMKTNPPSRNGMFRAARAIEEIHSAGGLVFLAHPLTNMSSTVQLEQTLEELVSEGLDGIETFYKPYPEEKQEILAGLAERYGLLKSAGSDYHGEHLNGKTKPGLEMPIEDWQRFADAVIEKKTLSTA